MKALVTGGAGFIGSHIVDLLIKHGYAVAVLDNLSTGNPQNLNPGADFYEVDLTDFAKVSEAIKEYAPDYLIHHAAQVDVTTSLKDPLRDAAINILGSINLFQEAYRAGVKRIVYASSAAIYGDPVELPLTEEALIEPLAPYGASKYTPEHYLRILAQQASAGYTILRYANVYGPRQNFTGEGGVVAIFSHRITKGERVKIFGDGEQTRDFIYVKDVARANLAALNADQDGVFNISTGTRVSVNELFGYFQEMAGGKGVCSHEPARPGEILHSALDPAQAHKKLAWEAQTNLEEGLKETYAYFLKL